VFDNVSVLGDERSDWLARLATGAGVSTRRLYTDDGEVLFQATKPVVLTSIPEVDRQPDLADRALHATFSRIDPSKRRTERNILAGFDQDHPAILGALCDAVSCALRNRERVTLAELPRMADAALFVTAA